MSSDIIDKQCTNSSSVVCTCDCTISFLAGSIPNLGLDDLVIDMNATRSEFDADGGFGLEAELVSREPGKQIGLADA